MKWIRLNDWQVCGYWPYAPELNRSMEIEHDLMGVTDWIPASVPGSVYADLEAAGYIQPPCYEQNSLLCEWVSNRWWVYKTSFPTPALAEDERLYLVFKGIDYSADIYLNQKKIGSHEGMYTVFRMDVTELLNRDAPNVLKTVMKGAPDEMGQAGYTSRTHTQKSRFNYKWDFSTRMVNVGLYGEAGLEITRSLRINAVHLRTRLLEEGWRVEADVEIDAKTVAKAELRVQLTLENGELLTTAVSGTVCPGSVKYTCFLPVPADRVALWNPNGSGDQALYTVRIFVEADGSLSDTADYRIGFRTLAYERAEDAPLDSLAYCPVFNGCRMYIKGINMVPLDHLYGCVTEARYRTLLTAARDMNINLIRVWGGGLIESEAFYSLCDELGLMVWQEFIQSSSGGDNVPSKDPVFLRLLHRTATEAVKVKRNHVCLTFYSGGNELADEAFAGCPDANNHPAGYDDTNLGMLLGIVTRHDPGRLMLPTSASGPLEFIDVGKPGMNHDVHGPWQYGGVLDHYAAFNRSDSILHSEFGCDGFSGIDSLREFLAPEHLRMLNMQDCLTWRHHGEWWDTYLKRDLDLFGIFEEDELEDYTKISQFMQAEAIRYVIESNRRRTWQNCGSIVWQLNEPWPNVSCTNIIEYSGRPKFACEFVRVAYAPDAPSLRYESLVWEPGANFHAELYAVSDRSRENAALTCLLRDMQGNCLKTERCMGDLPASMPVCMGTFGAILPKDIVGGFTITLVLETEAGRSANAYLFLLRGPDLPPVDRGTVLQFLEQYSFLIAR